MTDAILSEELYFKYLNTYERESRFRIDSFRFDGELSGQPNSVKLASALLRYVYCSAAAGQTTGKTMAGSPMSTAATAADSSWRCYSITTVDSRPGAGADGSLINHFRPTYSF